MERTSQERGRRTSCCAFDAESLYPEQVRKVWPGCEEVLFTDLGTPVLRNVLF